MMSLPIENGESYDQVSSSICNPLNFKHPLKDSLFFFPENRFFMRQLELKSSSEAHFNDSPS